jgi:hypothetical protein
MRVLDADGKLAEAGAKLEELERTIEELNRVEVPRKQQPACAVLELSGLFKRVLLSREEEFESQMTPQIV